MGNEYEMRTGLYTGRKKDGKRWLFYFDEGLEEDRKYSAFDPLKNLTTLTEGTRYSYRVEHVPMPKEPNKFYHNLTRIARDGDFQIETSPSEGKKQPAEAKQPERGAPNHFDPSQPKTATEAEQKAEAERIANLKKANEERIAKEAELQAQRKADNDKAIALTNFHTRRGGFAHDAAVVLAVLQQTGSIKIVSQHPSSRPDAQEEVIKLASELHAKLTDHMMTESAQAEAKFLEERANGSLKPQKG